MPFQFITYGRYVSVDGKWLIQRRKRVMGRGSNWVLAYWNEGTRNFEDTGHRAFKTLNDAKRWVTARTELAMFNEE